MDTFVKKIERLSEMAALRPAPLPLDATGVMARIRGLEVEVEDEDVLRLPLRFFAGGAVAAAVAAIAVTVVAYTAWDEVSTPFYAMDTLMDVMDVML